MERILANLKGWDSENKAGHKPQHTVKQDQLEVYRFGEVGRWQQ